MSKLVGILSKLVVNQHQLIIKGKTLKEAWKTLQERFQYINLINTSCFIYKVTTKKLLDFKDVHKYTSSYQVVFDKVISLLTKKSYYIWNSIKTYFQITMLMNISPEYSALVSTIQINLKEETTNLVEVVLQIIKQFKFIESTEKGKLVLQISTFRLILAILKGSYKNLKCIEKGLITCYTNQYQIKHPKLRQKYAFD